jgi:hypothetical protein
MRGKARHFIVILIIIFFVSLSGCISGIDSGKGTLRVTSSPSGAEIYLDDQYRGSTPAAVMNVEPGLHTLEIRYPQYQGWNTTITVSPGELQLFAELIPQPNTRLPQETCQTVLPTTPTQPGVTLQASKKVMVIGDSNFFSGTGVGCNNVLLTLYGPGYYSNGVLLDRPNVNSAGSWSYTWNPGYSVLSGVYTMIAEDPKKIASDRAEFSIVGGGEVSISPFIYAVSRGDTMTFSGQCTTGAQNVLLVLYGPDRFSSGVELGTLSVTADKTWSFKYTIDITMPPGMYTMYVYDIPRTTSSSTQFSVGFIS